MTDFPEPKTFNGGPGETGGHIGRSTGVRSDERAASDYRGLPCQRCGTPIRFVYTLADVGAFCSSACRDAATSTRSEVA